MQLADLGEARSRVGTQPRAQRRAGSFSLSAAVSTIAPSSSVKLRFASLAELEDAGLRMLDRMRHQESYAVHPCVALGRR